MAKDTYYFPHDYNPTSDGKIMGLLAEYGATGYGLYWRFVEMLHNEPTHTFELKSYLLVAVAKQMNSTSDFLLKFLQDCSGEFALFTLKDNMLSCERVDRNIANMERKSNIAKANGSKGGEARAKQIVATAKQNLANKRKENKGKENITSSIEEVINISAEVEKKYELNEWYKWPVGKTIIAKKENFKDLVRPFIEKYGKELCNDFWYYWTQPMSNKSGKLAWENENKFDIDARLRTFKKNNNDSNN